MIISKYKVGDRVADVAYCRDPQGNLYYEEYSCVDYGTVKRVNKSGTIAITWDNAEARNQFFGRAAGQAVNPKDLMFEWEVKPKLSALEDEFRTIENSIKLKMESAGKLLAEAVDLANKIGHELITMRDAVRPLTMEMDNIGWRTSSFNC